jgi:hypothetical protein
MDNFISLTGLDNDQITIRIDQIYGVVHVPQTRSGADKLAFTRKQRTCVQVSDTIYEVTESIDHIRMKLQKYYEDGGWK